MLEYRCSMPVSSSQPPATRHPVLGITSSSVHAQGAGLLAMQRMKSSLTKSASLCSVSSNSSPPSQEPDSEAPSAEELVQQELHRWIDTGVLAESELNDFDIIHFWDLVSRRSYALQICSTIILESTQFSMFVPNCARFASRTSISSTM